MTSRDVRGERVDCPHKQIWLLGTKTESLPPRAVRSPPLPPDVVRNCQNTSVVFKMSGYFCFLVRRASHQSTVSSLTPHGHGTAWCQQGHSSGMLYWPHGLSLALLVRANGSDGKLGGKDDKQVKNKLSMLQTCPLPCSRSSSPEEDKKERKSWNLLWTFQCHSFNLLDIECLPCARSWARVKIRKSKHGRPK